MSSELSQIIDALSLIEEARSSYPYERAPNGDFLPPVMSIPTWVWNDVVTAAESWRSFNADLDHWAVEEFVDEGDDGEIDQCARAFRLVVDLSETLAYRSDGHRFVPVVLPIPTSAWHEIVTLSHIHSTHTAELEKYRPSVPIRKGCSDAGTRPG